MQDLLRHLEVKIENGSQITEYLVDSCQACQVTNAISNPNNPGTRLREQKSGAYWETDFTEVKPRLFGYRYLLDTFSGWTKVLPTRHETVTRKLLEDILPRCGFPTMIG